MNVGLAQDWLDKAESCRQRAALYRRVIERTERSRGSGSDPRWAEIKAILLELAEDLEREAADAAAHAAEVS